MSYLNYETSEVIHVICESMVVARDKQKGYANIKRRDTKIEVGGSCITKSFAYEKEY